MDGPCREGGQGAQAAVKISEAGDEGAEGGTPGEFTFSADPSLEDIRRLQAEFVAERGWGQFHQPRNLLLALVGEVGEVAELFFSIVSIGGAPLCPHLWARKKGGDHAPQKRDREQWCKHRGEFIKGGIGAKPGRGRRRGDCEEQGI
ncbi:dCTP pyrophosphatase 1 isoform X2 [Chelonia mydas]|uniref:dCTP pyrophosphatase 1 isoform X2 n=1 Tax=Chelonia mydas TaxID=8469 RepID=UPI001CAA390B|nr:dCTP pyrophosphatase 1 isoform X2 [Chelonia mydas]